MLSELVETWRAQNYWLFQVPLGALLWWFAFYWLVRLAQLVGFFDKDG